MGYYINLKNISIDKYKEILKSTELIPSWKILEENIDEYLDVLKLHNIDNLEEVLNKLKGKDDIRAFSLKSGLPEKYLEVFKRVINGYRQKPNRIKDFICISEETVLALEKMGITNTLKFYDKVMSSESAEDFSGKSGISESEVLKLTKLTELSRIRWVNHTFAYVLLEAGYDEIQRLAEADYKELYTTIKKLNEEKKIYNAHIGERDMKMVIESARILMSYSNDPKS